MKFSLEQRLRFIDQACTRLAPGFASDDLAAIKNALEVLLEERRRELIERDEADRSG